MALVESCGCVWRIWGLWRNFNDEHNTVNAWHRLLPLQTIPPYSISGLTYRYRNKSDFLMVGIQL
jgi:hypothetical protein